MESLSGEVLARMLCVMGDLSKTCPAVSQKLAPPSLKTPKQKTNRGGVVEEKLNWSG